MNEIKVLGTQEFMGKEIPTIIGGFGNECKVVTDKMVAEIHDMKIKHVREAINNNKKRFKENIDFIDLKFVVDEVDYNLEGFGYSKMQISKSNNIYLLSERGYAKLIKIFDTDLAWQIHDDLIEEYFTMKETINEMATMLTQEQLLQLSIFQANSKEEAIIASANLDLYRREQLQLAETTIEEQKPKVEIHDKFMNTEFTFTPTQMAKLYGLSSGRKINQLLNENKICYKQGKSWMPYATTNQEWYKVVVNEFGSQLRFTSLGVIEISKVLELDIDEKELENVVDN